MTNWVFLRGLAREARHWGDFAARFQDAVNATTTTCSITLQDLPGNGAFNSQPSATSVGAMVEFARAQLAAANIKPPHCLLAMSLGAMVATQWATRFPQEVARLVLINTSMRPYSTAAQRLRPANWPGLMAMALRWNNAHFAEQAIFNATCQRVATRDADQAAWRQIRATAPVSRANLARQLFAAARYRAPPVAALAPLCPVLILSAAGDALVSPICSHHIASAWQAEHRQHDWAGHDLPHDDGQWVCQQVASWMALRAMDAPL